MGSATSHGIQLTPVKNNTFLTPHHYHGRKINRYAHPHNRVLPPPVAGQRLRSTDNGSILQEKGTIRGQRAGGSPQPSDVDPEFLAALQKQSNKLINNHKQRTDKWQSFSDPNISYSSRTNEANGKLRSKKKTRAPEPPSLSPNKHSLSRRRKNGIKTKHPAPAPPIIVSIPSTSTKNLTQIKLTDAISKEEENSELSLSSESRHLVCDIKNHIPKKETTPKTTNDDKRNRNDAFSEEIQLVTKRLAEKIKSNQLEQARTSPKQYYFPDVEIERTFQSKANNRNTRAKKLDQIKETGRNRRSKDSFKLTEIPKTKSDQIDTELIQKHNRIKFKPHNSEYVDDSVESCSNSSESLASFNESEEDIDLKLRPTLPRRQAELPKFSPTQAWKFLSAQHLDSIPSSEFGDDDEERLWRLNKLTKKHAFERCEDSGISPDIESPILSKEKHEVPKKHSQTVIIGQHSWIPQQDLLEDSDSNELEDCIRNDRRIKVPVKLMLPNEMFNSKFKNLINKTVNHNDPDFKENNARSRKVPGVRNTKPISGFINLKKTMDTRNKNTYAQHLDSNWVLNYQNNKMCKLTGTYNYVNSGGKKYLQSLIFGIKKNDDDQEFQLGNNKNGIRKKFSFYSTEGHVIYLPEYETVELARKHLKKREADNRRKKLLDERLTEVKKLDDDEWILQMQKQYRRERDLEKNNIRDKLKLFRREMPSQLNEESPESRSQSCENIPARIASLGGWTSNPENLNKPTLQPSKVFSSTSSSSPEIANYNRKQCPGGSRWMRRQRQPPQQSSFSPTRPEPEGGDTSSDENCQQTGEVTTNCNQNPLIRQPSVYTELMEVAKQEEQRLKAKQSSNPISTETEPKLKIEGSKEGTESSWKFKSGHQIQNHGEKNVPNKFNGKSNPPVKTFYMELEERMRQIAKRSEENQHCNKDDDSKISISNENSSKHLFPNIIVNEGGYKSVIQLATVQPFTPNKGYRPVPFKVPSVEKLSTENK